MLLPVFIIIEGHNTFTHALQYALTSASSCRVQASHSSTSLPHHICPDPPAPPSTRPTRTADL